jgi:hypothetical protein
MGLIELEGERLSTARLYEFSFESRHLTFRSFGDAPAYSSAKQDLPITREYVNAPDSHRLGEEKRGSPWPKDHGLSVALGNAG